MDQKQFKKILNTALERNGDWAEIFLEEKQTTTIFAEARKIERLNSGQEIGAGLRVVYGENTAYGFTNSVSEKGLLELAKVVARASTGTKQNISLNFCTPEPLLNFKIDKYPDQIKTEEKIAKVLETEEAARDLDEKIKQVSVTYGDLRQKVTIVNSEGLYVEDERIRTRIACNSVAVKADLIQTGFASMGATKGFEIFEDRSAAAIGLESGELALLMLNAEPPPVGKLPVVLGAESGGTMVHEACGHGLEADLVQKGMSVYAQQKNKKVASELVTVIDEAIIPFKYGSYRFDDEGSVAGKNVLIKKGILEKFLYDKISAKKDNVSPSGNGRRQSYKHRPIPRMSNTYIAPGEDRPEEIIRSVQKGIFVKKMGGGQVNTTNGDYVFDVAEGYLIEDGEIKNPIKGATLTGNGPETLQMVEMVGNDLGFTIGTCGKEGQGVPVSDAQPTIKVKELIIGGIVDLAGEKNLNQELKIIRI